MWVGLAGTYRAMNDAQKALDVLLKGAQHFESDGGYLYELGIGHLNAGKNDEAVATLKKAESITRNIPQTRRAVGRFHFQRVLATTKNRRVVMTIVAVTATP